MIGLRACSACTACWHTVLKAGWHRSKAHGCALCRKHCSSSFHQAFNTASTTNSTFPHQPAQPPLLRCPCFPAAAVAMKCSGWSAPSCSCSKPRKSCRSSSSSNSSKSAALADPSPMLLAGTPTAYPTEPLLQPAQAAALVPSVCTRCSGRATQHAAHGSSSSSSAGQHRLRGACF